MTKYEIIYHNATTNNESGADCACDTLTEALELVKKFRMSDEYAYITNTETDETFVTYDGFDFSVVPEV